MKMADKRYANHPGIPYSLSIPYPFIYPPFPPTNHYSAGSSDLQIQLSPLTSPPPNRLPSQYSPFYPPPNTSQNRHDPGFKKRENKSIPILDPDTKKEIQFVKEKYPHSLESFKESSDILELPRHEVLKIKQEFFQRIASAASKPEQLSPETKIKDEFKNKVEESLIITNIEFLTSDGEPSSNFNLKSEEPQNELPEKNDLPLDKSIPDPVDTMIFSNSKSDLDNIESFHAEGSNSFKNETLHKPHELMLVSNHSYVYSRETILKSRLHTNFPDSITKEMNCGSSKVFCLTQSDLFCYYPSNQSFNYQSNPVFTPKPRDKVNLIEKLTWILNLITPENYEKLSRKAINLVSSAQTKDHLENFIHCIFKKSINEPTYCEFYARLCNDMAKIFIREESISNTDIQNTDSKHVTFRRCLLTICQQEFEKDKDDNETLIKMKSNIEECQDSAEKNLLEEEYLLKEKEVHKHSLGNVRLIGELYRLNMLSENIIHECTVRLLKGRPTDDYLEALCRLFTVVGRDIDKPEAKDRIDQYFERIQHLMKRGFMSIRVKYLLMNLVDLRINGWVERREKEKPKTLDELHQFDPAQSLPLSFYLQKASTFHSSENIIPDSNSESSSQPILPKFSSSNLPSMKKLNSQRLFRPSDNWSHSDNVLAKISTSVSNSKPKIDISHVEICQSEVIKNSISILKEYEHLQDIEEVIQYLDELSTRNSHSSVVCGFFYSLNVSGGKLRFSLIDLFTKCLEQNLISEENFVGGIIKILLMIDDEDISEDCPLIYDFIVEVLISLYSSNHIVINNLFIALTNGEYIEFCNLLIGSFYAQNKKIFLSQIIEAECFLSDNLLNFVINSHSDLYNELLLSLKSCFFPKFDSREFKLLKDELFDSSFPDIFSKFNVNIYNKAYFLTEIILLHKEFENLSKEYLLDQFDSVVSKMPSEFHSTVFVNIFVKIRDSSNLNYSYDILQMLISRLLFKKLISIEVLNETKKYVIDEQIILLINQSITT